MGKVIMFSAATLSSCVVSEIRYNFYYRKKRKLFLCKKIVSLVEGKGEQKIIDLGAGMMPYLLRFENGYHYHYNNKKH